jgi:hypothetical protein
MWLRDNWERGERLSAAWVNQVGRWLNRLHFWGPVSQSRTSSAWTLRHDRPSTSALTDGDCRVVGPFTYAAPGEGTEAADAAAEDVGDEADAKPIRLYAMTRVAYYHAGDKKLYGYVRAMTFDAWGHLQEIGAETRVEIDVTGAC